LDQVQRHPLLVEPAVRPLAETEELFALVGPEVLLESIPTSAEGREDACPGHQKWAGCSAVSSAPVSERTNRTIMRRPPSPSSFVTTAVIWPWAIETQSSPETTVAFPDTGGLFQRARKIHLDAPKRRPDPQAVVAPRLDADHFAFASDFDAGAAKTDVQDTPHFRKDPGQAGGSAERRGTRLRASGCYSLTAPAVMPAAT
jgi:hypothetical protein